MHFIAKKVISKYPLLFLSLEKICCICYNIKKVFRRCIMNLQESGEMYLETIYILTKKMGNVRSIDVCEYMGYSKPSISRAMSILKNAGYITVDKNGYLTLTESGIQIAEKTYERHNVLKNLFIKMGVSEQIASDDACKIEHVISDEVFDAIKKHFLKM